MSRGSLNSLVNKNQGSFCTSKLWPGSPFLGSQYLRWDRDKCLLFLLRTSRWLLKFHLEVFVKIGAPKNFGKLTEKMPVQESFLKSCRPLAYNFIKKRLQPKCFPMSFANFYEHLFHRTPPCAFSQHMSITTFVYSLQNNAHLYIHWKTALLKSSDLIQNWLPQIIILKKLNHFHCIKYADTVFTDEYSRILT